ncbi:hypothetical protein GY21_03530 [Cryobacterium roopkundense]|uniref:Uncharacterized protein n=1 Tax=Cryobacterium roopkundense TaxID=1001240 RepID=A0A099JP81_9MICO|nr:hypothetical protein [Cryobacterium roopkundense]KGJ79961.1 hypothetical protein GY21_03530 [Cryobacterium roopkundense]MBB5643105.1 hypothetical protein [Cryobacterium roopkundense]
MHPATESTVGTSWLNQLAALRDQRALLGELKDDVQQAWRQLAPGAMEGSWRSSTQRAYSDRVEYLRGELQGVVAQLEDAESAVNRSIERVQAGA